MAKAKKRPAGKPTRHDQVEMTTMDYRKNRPKAKNPLKIEDLSLRDGHQSLFATRGRTEDMIPVAEMMDEVGFWAVETWGGATKRDLRPETSGCKVV